jgi:hypothetical protein
VSCSPAMIPSFSQRRMVDSTVPSRGARSAGNPHAACDVEGAGNVVWSQVCGQAGAPVLDPHGVRPVKWGLSGHYNFPSVGRIRGLSPCEMRPLPSIYSHSVGLRARTMFPHSARRGLKNGWDPSLSYGVLQPRRGTIATHLGSGGPFK